MANTPNDYRDPKVTQDSKSGGGIGKWLLISLAVLLALLLLGWLLGLIGGEEAVVVTDQPDAVVVPDNDPDAVIVTD